ncbi:hypothetical protein [Bacillus sp. ISL-39]|uniref:hypothetical protein n=1 Tax=Bacillus sp. ISL-39 TaxID=2819124 RepID=UPI001BE96FC2|nr:hypothetical protein [Bacillus sp. ISL-39]MBT2637064.1 hypothetical protein [Bacillus sp. ISL-39]
MKKTAVGLFHILPAESVAPGTKINSHVIQGLKSMICKNARMDFCLYGLKL